MAGGSRPHVVLILTRVFVSSLGGAMLATPQRSARFIEQIDAIGNEHTLRQVEPQNGT